MHMGTTYPSLCNHQKSCQPKTSVKEDLRIQVVWWPRALTRLLPLSFQSQTRHESGKGGRRTVKGRDFQKRQIKCSAHWTWTALGRPHSVAVYSFPWPHSSWRNRLSKREAGADHGINGEAILRHQTRQVWLFNQRKAKAENRHDCPL